MRRQFAEERGPGDFYCEGHKDECQYIVYAKDKAGFLAGVTAAEKDCGQDEKGDDLAREMDRWEKMWKKMKQGKATMLHVVRGDPIMFIFLDEDYKMVHFDMLACN